MGIEDDGSIVPPPNYDPLNEVPMLLGKRPGDIAVTALMMAVAEAKLPGLHVIKPGQSIIKSSGRRAGTVEHVLLTAPQVHSRRHTSFPAFVWMNTNNIPQIPQTAAHELDHWDFLMQLGMFEDLASTVVTSERRAHRTGLKVLLNLGQVTTNNVREFEEVVTGPTPGRFNIRKAQFLKYVHGIPDAHSVVANAISKRFGPGTAEGPATPHEITAYQMAGYA